MLYRKIINCGIVKLPFPDHNGNTPVFFLELLIISKRFRIRAVIFRNDNLIIGIIALFGQRGKAQPQILYVVFIRNDNTD